MSAIVSLLRVMTLRDAEAITLEVGKVPALRRRGQVENLAMPPLEARMLDEFVTPLASGKQLEDGPVMVSFTDADGTMYPVTLERGATGIRAVVRRPAPAKKPAPPAAPPPRAPAASSVSATSSPSPSPSASAASPVARISEPVIEAPPVATHEARDRLTALLTEPIAFAKNRGASDLLLSTANAPRIRVDGRFEVADMPVDAGELVECARALCGHDLSLQTQVARVRVNVFDHLDGYAIAARLIREDVPNIGGLGLPPELANIMELRDGLVLVCGPTGSGKSTTMAALIDVLDQKRAAHVITLEDPIEYRFTPQKCVIHQRELGTHIPTFAAGLRAALREAPDVILLGELRDRDTLAAALTAAETGHLVLATLHAPSAVGAIDRVIDAFPESQQRQIRNQLSACLRTIVTQFLLPRRDGGRAAALEIVPVTTAVANIIRKGDLHTLPTAIQSGRDAGMIPLERSLAKLIDSGAVAPKVVQKIAADHDLLHSLAGKLR